MRKLIENTVVSHDGMPTPILAGEDLPEWAVGLVGDHLLTDPEPEPETPKTPGRVVKG